MAWLVKRAQGKEMEVVLAPSSSRSSLHTDLHPDSTLPVHLIDNGQFIHKELVDAGHAVDVTGDNGVM